MNKKTIAIIVLTAFCLPAQSWSQTSPVTAALHAVLFSLDQDQGQTPGQQDHNAQGDDDEAKDNEQASDVHHNVSIGGAVL